MRRLNQNLFKFLAIFFLILPNLSNSEDKFIYSYNVRVIDGDSIEMNKEKIRLFGIDAPEMKQICNDKNNKPYACGRASRIFLLNYINKYSGSKIYCYYSERDRYKRIIGDCYIGENSTRSINRWMVSNGHAVAYLSYSQKYLYSQEKAKNKKFGIWAGTFDIPEEWRKNNK